MDRGLYIAMSGAKQSLLAQTSNSNNLANIETTGFKADLEWFRHRPVYGPGYPTRVYAMTDKPGTNFNSGPLSATGRDLDVAVNGDGMIAIVDEEGNEAYTRAGDFRLTAEGLLRSGTGLQVNGQNGPITIPPADKLMISEDGTISIIPAGSENATTLVTLDRIKLVKPDMNTMEKSMDGLVRPKNGEALEASSEVSLAQGFLEGSNVNAFATMTEMIELARNFELQTKVMKNVDENAAASAKLMQLG